MGGTLRGDKADLVDLLHRSGAGVHDGGNGDLSGLPHLDLVLVGVAVIEGQPQLGVVDNGGDGVALSDGVSHLQAGHLPQVAAVGRLDGELSDLVVHRLQILLGVVHALLGGGDRLPGGSIVHFVEGLTRLHLVALLDIELQDLARSRGDAGGIAGLGHAGTLDHGLDGPSLYKVGHDRAQVLGFPKDEIPQHHGHSNHHRGGNQNTGDEFAFTPPFFLFRPFGCSRSRAAGLDGLLHHGRLLIRHVDILLVCNWFHTNSTTAGLDENYKAMTSS